MRFIIIGIAVAAALSLSACGRHSSSPAASASSSKASYGSAKTAAPGSTGAVNVKKFCADYMGAVNLLQYNITDSTAISDLRKAQAEAPPAVKDAVTRMLNAVVAAKNSKTPTAANVTAESTQISNWGNSHC
ncbi:MAG: hypothetical protein ACRDHZ_15690 [Ktedonobacteraceae bacterium]